MKKFIQAIWSGIKRIFDFIMHTKLIKLVLLCALLVAIFFLGWFVSSDSIHAKSNMTEFGMKDIGELATQSGYFTIVNVLDDSIKLWDWNVPLTSSRYIFSYDGVAKAGVDFAEIDYSVSESKHEIEISLPQARLLNVEIDENSLEIYDEHKNIFTPLSLEDVKQSRITMIDEIKERAVANGLLEQANANAKMLIRGFISGQYDLSLYTIKFNEKE